MLRPLSGVTGADKLKDGLGRIGGRNGGTGLPAKGFANWPNLDGIFSKWTLLLALFFGPQHPKVALKKVCQRVCPSGNPRGDGGGGRSWQGGANTDVLEGGKGGTTYLYILGRVVSPLLSKQKCPKSPRPSLYPLFCCGFDVLQAR